MSRPSFSSNPKQRAYHYIRGRVLRGELGPGSKLKTDELARKLGMSRTPVREAIHLLTSEGLVEQVPDAGARVRQISRQEVEDLYEIRAALEVSMIGKAVRRITKPQILQLQRRLDEYLAVAREVQASGVQYLDAAAAFRAVEADLAFHMILLKATGNTQLLKVVGTQRMLSRLYRTRLSYEPLQLIHALTVTVRDHYRILQAIKRRDPKAARYWLRRHLAQGKDFLREIYEWEDANPQSLAAPPWPARASSVLASLEQFENLE